MRPQPTGRRHHPLPFLEEAGLEAVPGAEAVGLVSGHELLHGLQDHTELWGQTQLSLHVLKFSRLLVRLCSDFAFRSPASEDCWRLRAQQDFQSFIKAAVLSALQGKTKCLEKFKRINADRHIWVELTMSLRGEHFLMNIKHL